MRKILYLIIPLLLYACVGRPDDPWDPVLDPEDPEVPEEVPETGTRFFQRTLALEFTGTWCQYCPNMAKALDQAKEERPGRFVEIAIHYADDLAAAEGDALVEQYKVSAFPTLIFDMNEGTLFNEQSSTRFTDYIDGILAREENACGIAVASEVKGGQMNVSVSMTAASAGAYSLVAALVEDDIRVNQVGAGANYPCNAVLRSILSPGVKGQPTGTLSSGESFTAHFSAKAPQEGAKMRVVAWVLRNGLAVNAATCDVDGKTDYAYEKDN